MDDQFIVDQLQAATEKHSEENPNVKINVEADDHSGVWECPAT